MVDTFGIAGDVGKVDVLDDWMRDERKHVEINKISKE